MNRHKPHHHKWNCRKGEYYGEKSSTGNDIVDGVIWRQLLYFFFPIVLGTFFQQLYNTVDAVVVGQVVGKEALAAVGGTTGTLTNLLIGFFTGLSSGATVVISQFFGAGRHEEVRKAVHTAIAICLAVGAFGVSATTFVGQNFGARSYRRIRESVRICFIMAMGTTVVLSTLLYFFGPHFYRLFTNDSNVISQGMTILRVFAPFYFIYVSIEVLAGAVRGTGDALRPMLMTCIGVCVLRVIWIFCVVPLRRDIITVVVSYPITWTVTSLLFIVYYLRGNWLKRQIAKAGYPPEER